MTVVSKSVMGKYIREVHEFTQIKYVSVENNVLC